MKIVYVLISFVFVNVSANINRFMLEVSLSNKYIKVAAEHDDFRGNGLENVIKRIVKENEFQINALNVMIAVPEHASITNADIDASIHYQTYIRLEIEIGERIPVPIFQNNTSGNLTLTQLGDYRRFYTKEALKKIIINVLDGNETDVTSEMLCRFIGLWRSTKLSTLYIKTADIDPERRSVCILKDVNNYTIKYRSFNGIYWKVDVNDIAVQIIELKEQLLLDVL